MCMHGVKTGACSVFWFRLNLETGKQLAYQMFGTYATTYAEDYQYYTFDKLPAGDYTVGVQAVNYAYAATSFVNDRMLRLEERCGWCKSYIYFCGFEGDSGWRCADGSG